MPHPLTRAQATENAAFLRALERSGNVRLAAREAGIAYGTVQHRRRGHPAFAAEWDAALAVARARLAAVPAGPGDRPVAAGGAPAGAHRTRGGEAVVVRLRDGRCQVRRAQPGKLTRACEQAFLTALAATANVALSAKAAGAAEAAFYRRRRQNPGFAREMRAALAQGYERIEMALHEGFLPAAHKDDAWRHNDPPPIPPMSVNQALQLLYLHQKEARLLSEPAHLKRRRGESAEARSYRLAAMYKEGQRRAREAFAVAEAERAERGEPCMGDMLTANLPDLAQVTGWSRARAVEEGEGAGVYDPDVALFGGWRLEDVAASRSRAKKRARSA